MRAACPAQGWTAKRIRCVVHGDTEWEARFVAIIDTPEFQRLRNVRQLSMSRLVYPSATHSRFEHSIGVGHIAGAFGEALQRRHPDARVPVAALRLAGLCHDLGHGPLSHAFDRYLKERGEGAAAPAVPPAHEARSAHLLRRVVRANGVPFSDEEVETACALILGECEIGYAQDVLSNDVVDADKLDYLRRDSMHTTGMNFVDVWRFVDNCRIVDGRLAFHAEKMFLDMSLLVNMRLYMHVRVYQHGTARVLERMAIDYLELVRPPLRTWGDFVALSDDVLSAQYVELQLARGNISEGDAAAANEILLRVATRRLGGEGGRRDDEEEEGDLRDDHDEDDSIGFDDNPLLAARLFTRRGDAYLGCSHPAARLVVPHPKVALRSVDLRC